MNSIAGTAPNLNVLEGILSALRNQAESEYPALVLVMSQCVAICQSRHAVHAGVSFQLRNALESIRTGHPEDAKGYIEAALDIEDHWVGGVTQGFEPLAESPPLAKTVSAGLSRTPRVSVLRLIALTPIDLTLAVVVFAANTIGRALMLAMRPFAYIATRGSILHEALRREMDRPL